MTKKELLENRFLKMMPDDTEMVFNTASDPQSCVPISEGYLTYRSEITKWCKKEITGELEPIYKTYLVVNAKPY